MRSAPASARLWDERKKRVDQRVQRLALGEIGVAERRKAQNRDADNVHQQRDRDAQDKERDPFPPLVRRQQRFERARALEVYARGLIELAERLGGTA